MLGRRHCYYWSRKVVLFIIIDCIPEHTFKCAWVCPSQPFFPNIKAHHHFLPPPKNGVVLSASFLYLPLKLPSWIAWKKKVSVSLYSIFLLPVFTTWDIFKFRYTDDFLGTIENWGSQTLVLMRPYLWFLPLSKLIGMDYKIRIETRGPVFSRKIIK